MKWYQRDVSWLKWVALGGIGVAGAVALFWFVWTHWEGPAQSRPDARLPPGETTQAEHQADARAQPAPVEPVSCGLPCQAKANPLSTAAAIVATLRADLRDAERKAGADQATCLRARAGMVPMYDRGIIPAAEVIKLKHGTLGKYLHAAASLLNQCLACEAGKDRGPGRCRYVPSALDGADRELRKAGWRPE